MKPRRLSRYLDSLSPPGYPPPSKSGVGVRTSPPEDSHAEHRVALFGDFRLDLRTAELSRRGVRLRLQEQPFRILKMLLARPGEIVSREELRRSLWTDDTFVDFESGLNAAINRLRETLSDTARKPRFIETVPRRGYRFMAGVRFADTPEPSTAIAQAERAFPEPETNVAKPRGHWKRPVVAAVLAALMAAVMLLAWWPGHKDRKPVGIHSLAVLPLQNLSGDPAQEYFADGMTEALITALGQVQGLRVISRTSVMAYKDRTVPLAQIARELGVDAVVEGSVERAGNRVRITSQLIYVPDDSHLWAGSYEGDRSDVLALEDDVARAIALRIEDRLTAPSEGTLKIPPRVNPEAYEAYLQSRFFIENERNRQSAAESVRYAKQAISLDPKFALGYAGLAESYASLSYLGGGLAADLMPKARAAAEKAIQLDPSLAAAHTALGAVLLTYDYDWPRAESEFRGAIALGPNDCDTHAWYAEYFLARGKVDQALAEMRRAQALDPLSMLEARDLGRGLYYARRYDEAIAQLERAARLNPQYAVIDNWIGWAYQQKGDERNAIAALVAHSAADGSTPAQLSAMRKGASKGGLRGLERTVLKLADRSPSYFDPYLRAQLYASLGDRDSTFAWLEQAYQQRSLWLIWIAVDPAMDSLRGDPRYRDLVRRMKLQ